MINFIRRSQFLESLFILKICPQLYFFVFVTITTLSPDSLPLHRIAPSKDRTAQEADFQNLRIKTQVLNSFVVLYFPETRYEKKGS